VAASGASQRVTCERNGATLPVMVAAYVISRLHVQAASAAVSGFPSDHLPFVRTLNVQVFPSLDLVHEVAQSGTNVYEVSYWTSVG
jgi:hypothetical protein